MNNNTRLAQTDYQGLTDLTTYAHDLRNFLSTIKSSADLLLIEDTPNLGDLDILSLIRERALAATDLSDAFVLRKTLEAGLYQPFAKEQALYDLIPSIEATIAETVGIPCSISSRLRPEVSSSWTGDENLLLLTLRSMMRSLAAASGCRPHRFQAKISIEISNEGKLRFEFQALADCPRREALESERDRLEIFARALGGRLAVSGGSRLAIALSGLTPEKRKRGSS
jgi:hypothetical protein